MYFVDKDSICRLVLCIVLVKSFLKVCMSRHVLKMTKHVYSDDEYNRIFFSREKRELKIDNYSFKYGKRGFICFRVFFLSFN